MESINPRIALLTCNVDSFDDVREIPKQTIPFDYYYFSEANLPTNLNVEKRLLSKYPKLFSHKLLPDYDIYIWLDGRINIVDEGFVEQMITGLEDIKITRHPDRQTVQQEFDFIEEQINAGNPYLIQRYTIEGMEAEKKYFTNDLSKYPLYASGIFARRRRPNINKAFEDIWHKCIQCGNLDQVLFSLIEEKYKLSVTTLGFWNQYFYLNQHLKEYRKW
jgi:hypothetical protein